ncbi:hypothetical protein KCE64_005406 [Salmonella enterica subsp. enterica serovar Hvittingfoss]|nr:hypothetical protein [Salmonella enterica subsp. enterica serovar Hvittingfoss]EHL2852855.1 hypothetical protein [Salmonella enterica subsp. enterica serovar Hvittingfoss]
MTERLLNLKTLPALLVLLLCTVCTPAWAYDGACWVTAGKISLPNINTNTTSFNPGDALGSAGTKLNYTCKGFTPGERPQAQLVLSAAFISGLQTLKNAGLGMSIDIGSTHIDWSQLDPGTTGIAKAYPFGPALTLNDKNEDHSEDLNVTVYVQNAFKQISTHVVLALSDVKIRLGNGGTVRPPFGTTDTLSFSPFNINIIARNLIKLTLSQSSIDIGRFYAEYKNKDKQVPFSVTVAQDPLVKAAPNQHFKLPLMIQFGDGQSPPPADLTDSNTALFIKNDSNERNGLKLFLTKDSNPVYFNKPELMSREINIADSPYDSLTTEYMVHVVTDPGMPLKTGPFSVPIPVVITYK